MTPTPLSPEVQAELVKLRDIRLPEPTGFWPLAPGWWALIALCAVGLLALVVYEFRRRRSLRYLALVELADLREQLADDADPHPIGVDLAVLLRRVTLNSDHVAVLPGLAGDEWARELSAGEGGLSEKIARYLAQAPYAPRGGPDEHDVLQAAVAESERWIRRHA